MNTGQWKKPLVVGASGQVGAELFRVLTDAGCAEVLRSARLPHEGWLELDLAALRGPEDARAALDSIAPDLIVCAGAMTFVDGCEDDPQAAFRANAHGPSALASYAGLRGLPFVYFSSDYVFEGSERNPGPYNELAPTKPLSVYGQSKLQGERAVLRVHPGALIIRTSWVYGPDAAGKNFISTLLRQLRAGERLRVPADQVSTPTYNRDLAQATLSLLKSGASGVVHVTGPELMSRLELAQAVARFFSLDPDLVQGVPTPELAQRAPRPLQSGLISYRLPELLPSLQMRTLPDALADAAARLLVA